MARANPEVQGTNIPWSNNQYGSMSYGQTAVELWRRSYVTGQTPGYPGVHPLPYNAYSLDLIRRRYDAKFNANRTRYWFFGPTVEYNFTGCSAGFGVPQIGIENYIPYTTIFDNGAERKARARVIQEIQRIKVNVAQNVAEYRQVRNMYFDTLRRLTNAYWALRRGDIVGYKDWLPLRDRHTASLLNRGPLDIRRTAPSIWLEAQYGWLPLLGDIHTGIQTFYKRVESGYPILAKGTGTERSVSTDRLDSSVGNVDFNDWSGRISRCKYLIEYEVDHANLANMDDWGITNPLSLAWELVPYSFVVDWFLPIGDWLSQVGYSLGLHFRKGMRSGIVRRQTIRSFKAVPGSGEYVNTCKGRDEFEMIRWRREIVSGFPSPGVPRFDPNGLRGKRIINALSLLALAFDRKVKR